MTSIIYLIPISIGLGLCALLGFFWSVHAKQYDNMESDAHRILEAEDKPMSDVQRGALNRMDETS
ncbi:cbb3-type cytochrome oxidase assembly protein CcoS [uncultured Tateyamaria sp.]|uniref:cbb3-type cytochrome oxidase assembly protein CcoS n=2 Tax=uncultured Tateyamaria sp. TaxID=455651 RepID=UPI00261A192C|nr:cbb3-type cytochrome oxidase assembly protein CcoS [uncultured Tateyamaria sp.]